MVGTGKGVENGILIKSAESLELLHLIDTAVLDKTGTITEGKPKVTNIITTINEQELLRIAGSLEKNSEHPLAKAIADKVKEEQIKLVDTKEFAAVSGRGAKGKIDGNNYFGGNILFMTDIAIESADIVLMKNSLLDVVTAVSLSKAVIRNIKMNLFWALFYNCIGIPIACGIFYPICGLKLNPMIGALAMSFSSVCVVTNALRLRKFKSNFKEEKSQMNKFIKTIKIEGMQCNHCKMSVEKVLSELDGITKVEVSLENKKAIIESQKEIDNSKIKEKITDEGFKVIEIVVLQLM